jgi:hypothetical protein
MSRRFLSITVPLLIIGIVFQWLLSGWLAGTIALIELVVLSGVIASLVFLLSWKKGTWQVKFIRSFLLLGAITGFAVVLMVIFTIASNSFPGRLSKVSLSNGSGEIVFYQMSHIGTPRYYESIQRELAEYAKKGYIFYIEWVKPWTPESHTILDRSLGIRIGSGTYDRIASFLGMTSQKSSLYDGIPATEIRHTDLSVDDIIRIMGTGALRARDPIDIERELEKSRLTPIGQTLASLFLRAVMNVTLRSWLPEDDFITWLDPRVMKTLLDERNTFVIREYFRDPPEKTVFLYWGLHFEGMYHLLVEKDKNWQIKKYEPLYPYLD